MIVLDGVVRRRISEERMHCPLAAREQGLLPDRADGPLSHATSPNSRWLSHSMVPPDFDVRALASRLHHRTEAGLLSWVLVPRWFLTDLLVTSIYSSII